MNRETKGIIKRLFIVLGIIAVIVFGGCLLLAFGSVRNIWEGMMLTFAGLGGLLGVLLIVYSLICYVIDGE